MSDKCTAIVLAAGQGKRMGSKIQKQFLIVKEKPIIYYSLKEFEDCPFVQDIILVTGEDCIEYCQQEIVNKYGLRKVTQIISGGKERYDSVYAGLNACENTDYVFIHDGARPFISQEILQRTWNSVRESKACVVGMPTKDTVKIVNQQQEVEETPSREFVWTIQTPQAFSFELIYKAHQKVREGDMSTITDDSMVIETVGTSKVKMVEGSYENIKITTPEDLLIAEALLKSKEMRK